MSSQDSNIPKQKGMPNASSSPTLSLDWWAVIVGLALVGLILAGVIRSIPW
ncbi:MAG TPA: hypothetical protein VMT34_03090 [Aggregatilineales bacterium]|nr:hypothetical protein [Aggregatilineales bacterium]